MVKISLLLLGSVLVMVAVEDRLKLARVNWSLILAMEVDLACAKACFVHWGLIKVTMLRKVSWMILRSGYLLIGAVERVRRYLTLAGNRLVHLALIA